MIDRSWLTEAERAVLDEALITYAEQLRRIQKRTSSPEVGIDAKWRMHVVESMRDQLLNG